MPKKLKVIIVDDEALARADLKYMLDAVPEVESAVACANAAEALALMQDDIFDAIFLDIEMPGLNGLKAVKIINQLDNPPVVVFVTAYDEHAAKAFELNAVDYLVKPYNEKRLEQTFQKITKALSISERNLPAGNQDAVNANTPDSQSTETHLKKIPVEKGDGILLIDLADIRFFVAFDDRVFVNTQEDQYLCRFSLTELEHKLSRQGFLRVHRSYIANLQHILEIQPFFNGTYNLTINDRKKSIVPVSRARVKILKSMIGV